MDMITHATTKLQQLEGKPNATSKRQQKQKLKVFDHHRHTITFPNVTTKYNHITAVAAVNERKKEQER